MRVLHVNDYTPGDGHGGAERYLERLIAAQVGAGLLPEVFTGRGDHEGARALLDLWDPMAARRLRTAVGRFLPDVVHVHNVVRELSPSVLTATGVPTVVTFHDMRLLGGSEWKLPDPRAFAARFWVDPVAHRLLRKVAATTGVSEVVTRALRAARFPDPTTVCVPVPTPLVPPRPVAQSHDVLFAGRLSDDKGPQVLLAAFQQVQKRHPGARLVLAGDGPLRAALSAVADAQVIVPGALSATEVSAAMGRARVVVVPSLPGLRREGSSLTAVEAGRHGRPVVTSDDPAVAEIARFLGGEVLAAGDVTALAARLDHWLSHPEAATDAGVRAAAAAKVHDPTVVAERFEQIYRSVVAGTSP